MFFRRTSTTTFHPMTLFWVASSCLTLTLLSSGSHAWVAMAPSSTRTTSPTSGYLASLSRGQRAASSLEPTTTTTTTTTRTSSSTRLFVAENREKALRKELAEKNAFVKNEEKYAVADGEFLDRMTANADILQAEQEQQQGTFSATPTALLVEQAADGGDGRGDLGASSSSTSTTSSLEATMKRITKPRAFPLFLAEKAAEIAESILKGFGLMDYSPSESSTSSTTSTTTTVKERIVILGTGWGAVAFLKDIDTTQYNVTVISPRNYFLFTPMLAGASVGTVEFQSITQPIREINRKATYLEATATAIDTTINTVTCQAVVCDGNSCEIQEFSIEYDRLITTVGAQTNTFGIKGVKENCVFLKQIEDARRARTAIVNCFERANLPNLTDQERQAILTVAVIGAGPTGIEFAAELRDFIEQDGPKYYPQLLPFVRIKIIEASGTILAPFDASLQQEAIRQLNREVNLVDIPERFQLTELLLDSSVKEVGEKKIFLNDGTEIPYGLAIWAAGNGPIPLTLQLIDELGEEQAREQNVARGRVAVDPWMRATGSSDGTVLAFGDCSCISTKWGSQPLPATAQVASQQGEYLAGLMNRRFNLAPPISEDGILPPPQRDPERTAPPTLSDRISNFATNTDQYAKPFQFLNLGILAYTGGGSALAQITPVPDGPAVKGTGEIGNAVWRSVYLSKQVSNRNRMLILNDWFKRQLFGRDITRI